MTRSQPSSQAAKQYKWELNEARDKLLMSRCQVLKEARAGLGWAGLGLLGWPGLGWRAIKHEN